MMNTLEPTHMPVSKLSDADLSAMTMLFFYCSLLGNMSPSDYNIPQKKMLGRDSNFGSGRVQRQ